MNHRIGRAVFAIGVGLIVASFSYQWITNPEGREERALQVNVVETAREALKAVIGSASLEIVDPVSPNRKVGKAYVYPEGDAWSVSGYYRRSDGERWHPFLMSLDTQLELVSLKVQDSDAELLERARKDPSLEVSP
jgi:hypothetical protein